MALIAAHLNAGHSGGDSVAIGIYSPSSPTSIPPSLKSFMVSVDVSTMFTYLLTYVAVVPVLPPSFPPSHTKIQLTAVSVKSVDGISPEDWDFVIYIY